MNAQLTFLDGIYNLIHIPLGDFSSLSGPILRTLLPQKESLRTNRDEPDQDSEGLNSDKQHHFLNISITPLECSVVCHAVWTKKVFEPAIASLASNAAQRVSVSKDAYCVLSVTCGSMDAASRVMDLTSPLALAGISIFFISTYYQDFILVPAKDRQKVTEALLSRGFQLSGERGANFTMSSPTQDGPPRSLSPPGTPPPSSIDELQARTFNLLKKQGVGPKIEDDLELVQCSGLDIAQVTDFYAGHRPSMSRQHTGMPLRATWADKIDTKLYTCLASVLVSQPRFLSVTLAQDDPPSLLLDRTLLPLFGDTVVGDMDNKLVPIFLDLVDLPLEVTGIVCGVAGKLLTDMSAKENSELSYLSTVRAGAVVLPMQQSIRALQVLEPLLDKGSA